ncbi:hypothetical protein BH24ACT22_BH24ACT22_14160 [soil metagenome]
MGWSMDIPWWGMILIFLYLFGIRFGIGAIFGFVACHSWLSISEEPEKKDESSFMRNAAAALCGLIGGFVNYGVVMTFL